MADGFPANGLNRGPEGPAAHVRIYLALLPSGPDAVRRLKLHRFRTAMQSANRECTTFLARLRSRPQAGLERHSRRQKQIFRQHLSHNDREEVDVENAGGRL